MSGEIRIAEGWDNYWSVSGWCFGVICREIEAVLADTQSCPSLLAYLQDTNPNGPKVIDYINFTIRPSYELVAFRDAAIPALDRLRQRGGDLEGCLELGQKLIAMLQNNICKPSA